MSEFSYITALEGFMKIAEEVSAEELEMLATQALIELQKEAADDDEDRPGPWTGAVKGGLIGSATLGAVGAIGGGLSGRRLAQLVGREGSDATKLVANNATWYGANGALAGIVPGAAVGAVVGGAQREKWDNKNRRKEAADNEFSFTKALEELELLAQELSPEELEVVASELLEGMDKQALSLLGLGSAARTVPTVLKGGLRALTEPGTSMLSTVRAIPGAAKDAYHAELAAQKALQSEKLLANAGNIAPERLETARYTAHQYNAAGRPTAQVARQQAFDEGVQSRVQQIQQNSILRRGEKMGLVSPEAHAPKVETPPVSTTPRAETAHTTSTPSFAEHAEPRVNTNQARANSVETPHMEAPTGTERMRPGAQPAGKPAGGAGEPSFAQHAEEPSASTASTGTGPSKPAGEATTAGPAGTASAAGIWNKVKDFSKAHPMATGTAMGVGGMFAADRVFGGNNN